MADDQNKQGDDQSVWPSDEQPDSTAEPPAPESNSKPVSGQPASPAGDIQPAPKPEADPFATPVSAVPEELLPSESKSPKGDVRPVSLPADEVAYNIDSTPEAGAVPEQQKTIAPLNLFQRLTEQEHGGKQAPAAQAAAVAAGNLAQEHEHGLSPQLLGIGAAAVIVLGIGGFVAYLKWFKPPPRVPVAVPTVSVTPTPSKKPTPKPSPTIRPIPAPKPPPPANTYTVQSGDTLITIGEKLGKDWQAIAAANGIPDPNLIFPGQVLKIP